MKENSLSILFPRQQEVTYREIPEESWHDLGLDTLTERIAAKPQEVPLIRRVMMSLTPDPEVAAFRSDVFEDILRHPDIRERLMKLLEKVRMFYDYGVVSRPSGDDNSIWDLMHRLEEYHDYILTVEAIRECLSEKDLVSEGLVKLRETVDSIYRDRGFEGLRKDVEELRVAASEVRSLTVGINLNERFEAISLGLVSVNGKPFTKSGLLKNFLASVSPRDEIEKEAEWNGNYSYYPANTGVGLLESVGRFAETSMILRNPLAMMSLARIPEADGSANVPRQMDSAASMLTSRISRKLKDTLGKYMNVSVREIAGLIPELVFYTRWAEYIENRKKEGWVFTKPQVRKERDGAAGMAAEGLYNLKLVATEKPGNVVPNDLAFDARRRVFVLTGANRGGKTTVTQAVGQLFILAQSGISVPAKSFRYDPADAVLTHFPADEDKTLDLGRLGEELVDQQADNHRQQHQQKVLLEEVPHREGDAHLGPGSRCYPAHHDGKGDERQEAAHCRKGNGKGHVSTCQLGENVGRAASRRAGDEHQADEEHRREAEGPAQPQGDEGQQDEFPAEGHEKGLGAGYNHIKFPDP